jgi:uncharacterized membrane protein (UPF0127 family)
LRRLAAAALLVMACASKAPPDRGAAGPRVVVETSSGGRHVVAVEIARTEAERARGLMHRAELGADAGMLFLFGESADHAFWMRNTLIPLDMIFIADDGRIAGIVERAEPLSLASRSVGAPSRYVLEVNGGWASAHGVRTGDRVRFESVPMY